MKLLPLEVIKASDLQPWRPHVSTKEWVRFSKLLKGKSCGWCGSPAVCAAMEADDPYMRWSPWCGACDTGKSQRGAGR